MKHAVCFFALLLLVSVGCAPTSEPEVVSSATVIEGATLIDGVSGNPIEDAVLVIDGGSIVAVGPRSSVEIPEGAARIDASGKTIMPERRPASRQG